MHANKELIGHVIKELTLITNILKNCAHTDKNVAILISLYSCIYSAYSCFCLGNCIRKLMPAEMLDR